MPGVVDEFFSHVPLPYQSLDEKGMILSLNSAWSELMGYSNEEVVGMWFGELVPEKQKEALKLNFASLWEHGKIHNVEFELRHKDGHSIPIRLEGSVYIDQESRIKRTQCVFQDISQEVRINQLHRSVFEHSDTAYAIYHPVNDGEDFIFVDFNPAGETVEGIQKKELIGKRVTECFPGIVDSPLFETFKRVHTTGIPEKVKTFFYTDSRQKGYRSNKVFRLPSGEIVANYHDVSELEGSKYMLESIYNLDRNLIFTTLEGQNIISCNRSFLNFFQIKHLNEFKQKYTCICELFIEDKEKGYIGGMIQGVNWVKHVISQQDQNIVKARIGSNIFSLFASALEIDKHERFLVILSDITLQETYQQQLESQVEQKSAEANQLLEMFEHAESVGEFGIIHYNSATKKGHTSKGAKRILHSDSKESHLPSFIFSLLHEEDKDPFMHLINDISDTPGIYEIEYRIHDLAGETRYIHDSRIVMEDGIEMLTILRDITHQKELETLQTEHQQTLFEQHKLDSLKEMFKLIAHHWRQPLNSISLLASTLQEFTKDKHKEESDQIYGLLTKELKFLSNTIGHFSDITSEESRQSTFDVKELLENEIALFEHALKERNITVKLKGKRLRYTGNRPKFMRIFHSVFKNAEEAIIAKQAKFPKHKGRIFITLQKTQRFLGISIRDNGIGMDDSTKAQAFTPYFTTKFQSKGVGLSLSICHDEIRNIFEGDIIIDNRLEEGVEVILRFPIEQE